jgi:predicted phage replisome organizer
MFDNRKIKHLRRLPEGNNIVLIWVMLLTMAGRCNSNGMIFLTENIPYTHKMLADELDFEENTVKLALTVLEQLNMVVTDKGFFTIAGWEEYQNIEGMDKIREQNRIRQANYKAKQKLLQGNVSGNVTVTLDNAPDIDKEQEKESDKDKDIKISSDLQSVVDLYHSICVSYPRIRSLSDARKKAIKARLKSYSLDDFRTLFENAEASSFLKGTEGGWKASFDWLIKEANMLKVLEGNYTDKPKRYGYKEKVPGWMGFTAGSAEMDAIKQIQNDPDFQEEQEQLRRELQASFGRNP